jgi:hypothetical protein
MRVSIVGFGLVAGLTLAGCKGDPAPVGNNLQLQVKTATTTAVAPTPTTTAASKASTAPTAKKPPKTVLPPPPGGLEGEAQDKEHKSQH